MPTGSRNDPTSVAVADAVHEFLGPYWQENVTPVMEDIASYAAHHRHNPDLQHAVVRLGLYINRTPVELPNDLARADLNVATIDDKELGQLIDAVRIQSRGYDPHDPDYGPAANLRQALAQLKRVAGADAVRENVIVPAVQQAGLG